MKVCFSNVYFYLLVRFFFFPFSYIFNIINILILLTYQLINNHRDMRFSVDLLTERVNLCKRGFQLLKSSFSTRIGLGSAVFFIR